jgi:tryptophan-rich sensory protein
MDWIPYDVVSFAVFVGLVIAAAAFGGQWGAGSWYNSLSKPDWTPPNWLFPIAWTALYLMIALAGWLVWETPHQRQILLLALWAAQLLLNALWSFIFFGRRRIALALADIGALWTLIVAFIILAWPVNQRAALFFTPYLFWISYAGVLNAVIWRRNPAET